MIAGAIRDGIRKKSCIVLLPLITLLGLFLRLHELGRLSLWPDEGFSIWMARHSLHDMVSWLIRVDTFPPLYYALLHFWTGFGESEAVARGLSVFFGTLTIPVIYFIGRRLADEETGLVAALFLAMSSFNIIYAQDARSYTLLCFTAAMAMLSLAYLLPAEPGGSHAVSDADGRASAPEMAGGNGRRVAVMAWTGYIMFTALTLYTHGIAFLLPAAANLYMAVLLAARLIRGGTWPDAAFIRRWLGAQVAVLVLWAPWIRPFMIQADNVINRFWIEPPTLTGFIDSFNQLIFTPIPGHPKTLAVTIALFATLLCLGIGRLRRNPGRLAFLLVFLLSPIMIEMIISIRRPVFLNRTLIWTTIPLYLLLAFGFRSIRPRFLAGACMALIVAVNILSIDNYFDHAIKEQWRETAAHVADTSRPGDLILFNSPSGILTFDYYFRGYGRQAELRGMPSDLGTRDDLDPEMSPADLPHFTSVVRGRSRVWLVRRYSGDQSGIVPRELGKRFRLTDTRLFYRVEARLYEAR